MPSDLVRASCASMLISHTSDLITKSRVVTHFPKFPRVCDEPRSSRTSVSGMPGQGLKHTRKRHGRTDDNKVRHYVCEQAKLIRSSYAASPSPVSAPSTSFFTMPPAMSASTPTGLLISTATVSTATMAASRTRPSDSEFRLKEIDAMLSDEAPLDAKTQKSLNSERMSLQVAVRINARHANTS